MECRNGIWNESLWNRISNRMEFTEWNTELTDVELTGRNRM